MSKRTPGGGSPSVPDAWYNLEQTDLSTMSERELTELREYLMELHSDAREDRRSRDDTMPHYITEEDELMREILDVVRMVDDEMFERDMKADKRLGDPSRGPDLPHREELEGKSTAELKRLKDYYLRQYEDEPDTRVAQNILYTVRDVEDILVSRGEIERADIKAKDEVFDSHDIESLVMEEISDFVQSGSVSEEEAIEALERVKRQVRQEAPETYYRSEQSNSSRVYVESRQEVPQGRQARMDEKGSVFYTLSQEPKEASNSVAQSFREEYPDDLEDETPGTTEKQDTVRVFVGEIGKSNNLINPMTPFTTLREVIDEFVDSSQYGRYLRNAIQSPLGVVDVPVDEVEDVGLDMKSFMRNRNKDLFHQEENVEYRNPDLVDTWTNIADQFIQSAPDYERTGWEEYESSGGYLEMSKAPIHLVSRRFDVGDDLTIDTVDGIVQGSLQEVKERSVVVRDLLRGDMITVPERDIVDVDAGIVSFEETRLVTAAEKSSFSENQERWLRGVVDSVADRHYQRDIREIVTDERPSTWKEVAETLIRMYTYADNSTFPKDVLEEASQRVMDEVLSRYSSVGGPMDWYRENVMSESPEQERGYPYSSEYRPQSIEGRPSMRRSKAEYGADARLAELGFQPSHRGAGMAQCLECGEHVARTQLDIHMRECPQRSKEDDDVDPDEIEDPDDDGEEEFDIEGDPDEIEDPDDDGEEEMDVDPSEDDEKEDPCWDGYKMIGTKVVDGEEVPNCVPKSDSKSVGKQEPREGLEWSEKVVIVNVDEEENEVTLEDQLTGTEWTETVDDIEGKLEALNERDHGWLYDMIEGQYPEIDASTAHEVLHEFDRLADDPSEEVLENMARVSKVIQKYGNRLYIAEQEDVPSDMDAEYDGQHYVVETANAKQLAEEIAPQGVVRMTDYEFEWLESPEGSEARGILIAEAFEENNVLQRVVREASNDMGRSMESLVEPTINEYFPTISREDKRVAVQETAEYVESMMNGRSGVDDRYGYRRSKDSSSGCPECGSELMEKGECQVCGCKKVGKAGRTVTVDNSDVDALLDVLGAAALEAAGGDRASIYRARKEISGKRSRDKIQLDGESAEGLRTALEYLYDAMERVDDVPGFRQRQMQVLEDTLERQ